MSNRMRGAIVLLSAVAAVLTTAADFVQAGDQPARGDVVFRADFDSPDPLKPFGKPDGSDVKVEKAGPTRCLHMACGPDEPRKGVMISTPLPVEQLRGMRLRCSARVKADGVAQPPNSWNGVKCMLHIVAPGGSQWVQQNNIHGTFDWKPVGFMARVPADATEMRLCLGLEQTHGQVWFDDIRISVAALPRTKPAQPPAGPPYKGHTLARLRGTMINTNITEADLRVLGGEWKANHVRWQLTWGGFPRSPADKGDLDAYDKWLEGVLQHLDKMLPVCRELGILVLVDLHTPPGGRDDANDCRLFQEKRFQDKFVEVWEKMARRYKGNKTVWGYDLVNEPCEGNVGEGCMDWQDLATAAAKKIREIDGEHAIIVEPAPWGGAEALANLEPIPVPGVVYSVHMYQPHQFTHQGVYGSPTGIAYPGKIDGKDWDKDRLKRAFQPVVEFQRDYGVHMYIGEFSAIRWAPGDSGYAYLRDVIDIMEGNGWDWAYHAFREWDGWSVEHGGDQKDRSRSAVPTKRQELLTGWFAKNERAKP